LRIVRCMSKHLSRLGYCQYLLTSPTNYTLTNFADHVENMSHDAITRYLRAERLTPRLVWDNVYAQIVTHPDGCVLFDDSVLDKDHSRKIELVRRQYSGNAHGLIKGIGVVNCVYVNPQTGEYWCWRSQFLLAIITDNASSPTGGIRSQPRERARFRRLFRRCFGATIRALDAR